jgi:hypothetical protein
LRITGASRTPLFRIGLLCWVRIGESRDRHAGLIDAHDPRIAVERKVEGLGRRHLSHETDIRDGWPIAVTEPAARGMFGEQRLHGLKAGAEPALIDAAERVSKSLQYRFQSADHFGKLVQRAAAFEFPRVMDHRFDAQDAFAPGLRRGRLLV